MSEIQNYVMLGLSVACAVLGWFGKTLYFSVVYLKEDINRLSISISEKYVRKEDYKADVAEMKSMLARINDKLDYKADKQNSFTHGQ